MALLHLEEDIGAIYSISRARVGENRERFINISLSPFLSLLSHPQGDMYNQEGDPSEPEWVRTEREQFTEFRDTNKDGRMDKEETKDWILPSDYDHAEAEAKHLVYESDNDKVHTHVDV